MRLLVEATAWPEGLDRPRFEANKQDTDFDGLCALGTAYPKEAAVSYLPFS
jgi:hypothetical protein